MQNQGEPQGILFDSIAYYNSNQLEQIIDNISKEQSLFYMTIALQHSYKSGIFSMVESEIISKSLRILNSEEIK